MSTKPPSLITFRVKGSQSIEERAPVIRERRGIPYPVHLNYAINKILAIYRMIDFFRAGASILCIENTILEAQQLYNLLCSQIGPDNLGLLHSRFTAHDRDANEQNWISRLGKDVEPQNRRDHPCIVVGTQVCEQSLDIDADILFTSVCPIDMFLQRIGRIWRHRKFDPVRTRPFPEVYWYGWEGSTIERTINTLESISDKQFFDLRKDWRSLCIYDGYVMARTIVTLNKYTELRIPDDIRTLLEDTYADEV